MNVRQCPECKRHNVKYSILAPRLHGERTEIKTAAYCPDCGSSWDIIYTPDRTENRQN